MNAIEFNNVWKKFKKGEKFDSLRDMIPSFFKGLTSKKNGDQLTEKEFWAVKDVNFHVKKGDVVGVIGPNGAGKSTILKLLSGIIVPNKGTMKIQGRLSALIEVTAGFHPELTGRENVYLNGTILGMKKKELDAKFDEIVDFSGIREFIDTPVKRYSSGMYSRLGFSVAAHVNPDVLLVDEVLAVGDIAFQSKCAEKMRQLLASGVTIVIVSHNLGLIRGLCQRVILIHKGEMLKEGKPDDVIPYYENIVFKDREEDLKKRVDLDDFKVRLDENDDVVIHEVQLLNGQSVTKEAYTTGDHIRIKVDFEARKKIERPIFSMSLVRSDGIVCFVTDTQNSDFRLKEIDGKGSVTLDLGKINLTPGLYVPHLAIFDRDLVHPYALRKHDLIRIEPPANGRYRGGIFTPEVKWE